MAYSPVYPLTTTVSSSYTSGAIYVAIRDIDSGSFQEANLGKPVLLFAIPVDVIPALTGTLSASYFSYTG